MPGILTARELPILPRQFILPKRGVVLRGRPNGLPLWLHLSRVFLLIAGKEDCGGIGFAPAGSMELPEMVKLFGGNASGAV